MVEVEDRCTDVDRARRAVDRAAVAHRQLLLEQRSPGDGHAGGFGEDGAAVARGRLVREEGRRTGDGHAAGRGVDRAAQPGRVGLERAVEDVRGGAAADVDGAASLGGVAAEEAPSLTLGQRRTRGSQVDETAPEGRRRRRRHGSRPAKGQVPVVPDVDRAAVVVAGDVDVRAGVEDIDGVHLEESAVDLRRPRTIIAVDAQVGERDVVRRTDVEDRVDLDERAPEQRRRSDRGHPDAGPLDRHGLPARERRVLDVRPRGHDDRVARRRSCVVGRLNRRIGPRDVQRRSMRTSGREQTRGQHHGSHPASSAPPRL